MKTKLTLLENTEAVVLRHRNIAQHRTVLVGWMETNNRLLEHNKGTLNHLYML